MFTLKYTSSLPELQEYLDDQFEQYVRSKSLDEEQTFMVKLPFEEERRLLMRQVYGSPETLKEMCFMAFLGHLAKEKKLVVSNMVTQCPFLLYLLGVVSFDVFEEGYGGEDYLFEKSQINTTNYYVDDNFYKLARKDIDNFLEQSGHVSIWIGHTEYSADCDMDREPVGIQIVSSESDVLEHKCEFGELYDGTDCILEENTMDSYRQGSIYQLLPLQHERKELSEDERLIIDRYKNHDTDKSNVMNVVASGMIVSGYETPSSYYHAMKNFGDNVYSREALYKYLLAHRIKEEKALYWTEIIRKGTLERKLREHKISYHDYAELYLAIGKERIDLFCDVHYMPSCWSVMEKFYRITEQKHTGRIIAVDFDGTLSLGTWPSTGPANKELIDFLKEQKENGDKLILWTCREGEALKAAVRWCEKEGLVFDSVNDNIPEMIERYGTNSRKVSCDYYIDDRAVWTNAFGLLR